MQNDSLPYANGMGGCYEVGRQRRKEGEGEAKKEMHGRWKVGCRGWEGRGWMGREGDEGGKEKEGEQEEVEGKWKVRMTVAGIGEICLTKVQSIVEG